MKYFTSFGLKGVKIHKIRKIYFFLPSSNKFAIQNNPLMQLLLIFHKKNWKSENFKVLVELVVFQQFRKVWKEGEGKFISFLSLFLTLHINVQYKLKYHTSLFTVTFYLFASAAFFSFAISLFFSLIFDYKFMNMCKWVLSLAVPYFVSNFN